MNVWHAREAALLLTALVYSSGLGTAGAVLMLVVLVWELAAGERLWPRTPLDSSLAGLVGVVFLAAAWSPWRGIALTSAAFFAISATAVIRAVVLSVWRRPPFAWGLLAAWAAGGAATGLIAVATMASEAHARAQLPHLGPNALGTALAVASVLLLGMSSDGRWYRRLLCLAGFLTASGGLLLTWSRGAWLGALAGSAVLLARTAPKRLWPGVLAVTAVVILSLPATGPRLSWHLARILDSASPEGPTSRIPIWRVVPRIVIAHPVLGTGLGTFPLAYARYAEPHPGSENMPFAHNILLNFMAETGIAGLAALLHFLGIGVAAAIRWHVRSPHEGAEHLMSALVLAALTALLAQQMVDGTVMGLHIAVGLYLLLGLSAARGPHGWNEPTVR